MRSTPKLPPSTLPSLAQRLRDETRALHIGAERSRFIGALVRGEMRREAYCALLRNLHVVYAALEPALRRQSHVPVLAPAMQPELWRTQSLGADLTALHGAHWATDLAVSALATDYAQHLQAVEHAHPERLLAHAYVRYLGDLSGGQILRGIVARSIAPTEGAGTSFYDFGGAEQAKALALAFREGLARIDMDRGAENDIVAESIWAFEMHRRLFDELAEQFGIEAPALG